MSNLEFRKQPKPPKNLPKHSIVRREAWVVFFVLFTAAVLAYSVGFYLSAGH